MGNSADIFWTDIMLTGLGAIMDVTVTISAATGEIVRKKSIRFYKKADTFREWKSDMILWEP